MSGPQARDNRAADSLMSRARAFTSLDSRTPTDFGVLRSNSRTAIQWTTNDPITAGSGAVAYIDRAFLQWAGLTAGEGAILLRSVQLRAVQLPDQHHRQR